MSEPLFESSFTKPDESFEKPLRPESLTDFIGQDRAREQLSIFLGAAKKRKETLGHCLFSGPPGLGKTTLAHIMAKTMGVNLVTTSGPVIEKAGDLAGLLTNLKEGDILFIDEIHRLSPAIEEYLYPAMEDYLLDLMIDSGPAARSVQVKLSRFCLIGATTRAGLLSAPMRSRFAFSCRLDYYEPQALEMIIERTAKILNLALQPEGAAEIAIRCRGTPRIANHLVRWVRDYAEMHSLGRIDGTIAHNALQMLNIDKKGLDEMDKRILALLIDHYEGGPVGLSTLAIGVGEEPDTIAEVHEPYLILQGFLRRTPRGREATELAYQHLKDGKS